MIRKLLARLVRMDTAEATWRGTTVTRAILDRARARVVAPRWRRRDLRQALARNAGVDLARTALAAGRWDDAHHELARHFMTAGPRFVVSASSKAALRGRILAEFPDAAHEAAARADHILAGKYDLLGYQRLSFDARDASGRRDLSDPRPDWHFDPVHDRRAPRLFWSAVPYLTEACGDHKIIWELNRHQHWIVLGRAFWLTGERKYHDRFVAELESWLDANPPLTGINWASMLELAFRSLSWVWAIQLFVDGPDDMAPWLVDLLAALDRQLTHVERNLSYYFSPNTHLLGEALALYVAGRAIPELAASGRRARVGRRILVAEIDRQIVADGGHAERSTHYHRYALDFYMMALAVARNTHDDTAARHFERAVARLGAAARILADDRGRIPHIGDDDGGVLLPLTGRATGDLRDSLAIAAALVDRTDFQVARTPEEALWMLGPNAPIRDPQSEVPDPRSAIRNPPSDRTARSSALPDTGYYISRSPAGDHLIIDGGPHGYQNGGHAHADALALTLTVRGLPLLIDPGTGCYTSNPALRDRMRSSALHNTLVVDKRSQSAPDGPFHWSHVARTRVHTWRTNEAFDYFDASHDGYRPVEHRRRVFALHNDLVVVADLVRPVPSAAQVEMAQSPRSGNAALRRPMHEAAVHWHLDPNWTVDSRSRGATLSRPGLHGVDVRIGLTVPQGVVEHFTADEASGLGWHSPEYGRLERTTTVRITQSGAAPFWMATVFDLDPANPVADVDWVPVWAEAGATAHAAAIRITRATSVDHVLFAEPAAGYERLQSAIAASAAMKRGLWRIGEIETDARMLFCRTTAADRLDRIAMVDGSIVRSTGRAGMQLRLPLVAPSLFWTTNPVPRPHDQAISLAPARTEEHARTGDYGRTKDQEPRPKDLYSCAASPVS
jgi:hypothetical protein